MAENGILAVFAHPDDETFGLGGIMARYSSRGVPITMVCATRGEVGEIAPGVDATPENLHLVRERELREAMRIVGVNDVRFLGFRDSGMKGTADNEDPRAFMNAHPDAVVHLITRIIREVKPAVVVTWDESGGYGHPDHIAAHHHATAAYHAAADPSKYPTSGPPWKPKALFYNCIPVDEFQSVMRELQQRTGADVDPPGDAEEMMRLPRVTPNVVIDVSAEYDRKMEAFRAHASQLSDSDVFLKMPDDLSRRLFAREWFYRASPPVPDGKVLQDLFEDLP